MYTHILCFSFLSRYINKKWKKISLYFLLYNININNYTINIIDSKIFRQFFFVLKFVNKWLLIIILCLLFFSRHINKKLKK